MKILEDIYKESTATISYIRSSIKYQYRNGSDKITLISLTLLMIALVEDFKNLEWEEVGIDKFPYIVISLLILNLL